LRIHNTAWVAVLALGVACSAPAVAQWKGKGEVGIVFARGNSDTDTANVKLDLSTVRNRWKHGFGVAALRAATDGIETAERYGATGQSDYALTDRSYWFGGLRYEKDEFSGFEYQASATTGLGYKFIDSAATKLSGQAGVGYRRSKLLPLGTTEGDTIFRGDIKFEHALTATTQILDTFIVEAGADNTFASNELALQVKMSDRFALSLGVGVRYNTDPPLGLKKTDTLTTVNLVYAF
jgi:putative salt-induced outer membrane protein